MIWALGGVAVILFLCIFFYNRIHKLAVKVAESSAGIDVALEKRYDLLSEELEAVQRFLKHEYETYTSVVDRRSGTETEQQRLEAQTHLSREALSTLDKAIQEQSARMEQIGRQVSDLPPTPSSLTEKVQLLSSIQHSLGSVRSSIDALSEQYPALYSCVSMEHFQQDIFHTEEHLQAARRLYNANVSAYNQALVTIPYLFFAKLCGMKPAAFFQVEEEKKNFQVTFRS
ncbi:MAG TPA: LemA family protein [Candidatus Flavonifractor merdigallinarum]|uniref:LemA family protein n=1 Tax=Candidatus Flavonifractor merdigallinarum TaxID=2838589 RepID=A0A9D1YB93_9FIRM|nr:LemA family protein [Candidatus Flavonifractor merdigallinarum]